MTGKKVKLQYIANDSKRKATFEKRKKGIVKKMTELTTLCGIEGCAIIYGPHDAHPEAWPSPAQAQRLLSRYKKLPEMKQTKKMMNQEGVLKQRLDKQKEKLQKQWEANREKELTRVMNKGLAGKLSSEDLAMMDLKDLKDLGWVIDQNLKSLNRKVNAPSKGPQGAASSSMVAPPPPLNESVGQDPQYWFKDVIVSAAGDGNPGCSNSNRHFP